MSNKITLYHGSNQEIRKPDINRSRVYVDFGAGFYLTPDIEMAKIYASCWCKSVVSVYEVDLDALKKYEFALDEEWFEYVKQNYRFKDTLIDKYDVLIGPTADNEVFYENMLSESFTFDKVLKFFDSIECPAQYALKTRKAIKNCRFVKSFALTEEDREKSYGLYLDKIQQSCKIMKLCNKE